MLRLLDKNDFDKVYKIMEKSFPADEYRPFDEQKALFEKDEYKVYICEDNGDIKGFIALWEFTNLVYIEHFAVSPSCRNCGIGSDMLRQVTASAKKLVCLEVEPPNEDISIRRIGFYERNGFYLSNYPYMQPAISEGRRPVPLRIMTFGKKIDRLTFNDIKYMLYTNVYNISN